jgi:hypothetical protein
MRRPSRLQSRQQLLTRVNYRGQHCPNNIAKGQNNSRSGAYIVWKSPPLHRGMMRFERRNRQFLNNPSQNKITVSQCKNNNMQRFLYIHMETNDLLIAPAFHTLRPPHTEEIRAVGRVLIGRISLNNRRPRISCISGATIFLDSPLAHHQLFSLSLSLTHPDPLIGQETRATTGPRSSQKVSITSRCSAMIPSTV